MCVIFLDKIGLLYIPKAGLTAAEPPTASRYLIEQV